MEQIPIKCDDLSTIDEQAKSGLAQVKGICANQKLSK